MTTIKVKTQENGLAGSRSIQEQATPFLPALRKTLSMFIYETWKAFAAARYVWRKARKVSIPYQAESNMQSPSQRFAEKLGFVDPYAAVKDEEPGITLFRTEAGFYFTEAMMQNPKYARELAGVRIRFAHRISHEEAETLVEEIEAMIIDGADLDENTMLVLTTLKKMLADRFAR